MSLSSHPVDGNLAHWSEITAEFDGWSALLLGNGLSMHVWNPFGYPSLFEKAGQVRALSDADRTLFRALDTSNFERVLADLAAAIRMAEALGQDSQPYLERYSSIQMGLGKAVRSVHVNRSGVPDESLEAIGRILQEQEYVFTTSYDLILYWAMGAVKYQNLCDCFWGEKFCFDPEEADIPSHLTPVYFLHGALHLVVMGSGVTRKLTQTSLRTLLDQFGRPLDGDKRARPLLITEGSSQNKLQAIEGNDYLAHGHDRLGGCGLPLVVFGSDLGEQDQHLVDALNRNPDRALAVSIRRAGKTKKEIRSAQGVLRAALDAEPLVFFEAESHPLGSPELAGR